MTAWTSVLLAAFAVYSWKIVGYFVPERVLKSQFLHQLAGYLTIALLAGLVGVQTFITKSDEIQTITFDARVPAFIVGIVLLKLRFPFIVVVIIAGAVAAGLRLVF